MQHRRPLLLITALIFVSNHSNAILLDCNYGEQNYDIVGAVYACDARITKSGSSDDVVATVMGNHQSGHSHIDVKGLQVSGQRLENFPKQIERFFANLRAIYFSKTEIFKISSDDLQPFPLLVNLVMNGNQLVTLDGNLFEHTPNLQRIDFDDNKILHVGVGILNHLNSLQTVWFDRNVCISQHAISMSGSERESFKLALATHCKPTDEMLQFSLLNSKEFSDKVGKMIDLKLDKLTARIEMVLKALERSVNQ